MDTEALLKLRVAALEEQNQLLMQTMVVKSIEMDVCKCGVPHKLMVLGLLSDAVEPAQVIEISAK